MTRVVATSDWHLGYQAYTRLTPDGTNMRERDVAISHRRLIDGIIAAAPDVVLVAGDLFHSNRPSNRAIIHLSVQLRRLRAELPNVIVVIIGGNHDLPRVNDTGCILPLFAGPGVHVVDRVSVRLRFGELAILCIPDGLGMRRPALVPDDSARLNTLLLHGEITGVTQGGADRRVGLNEISAEELDAAGWEFGAVGHYHELEEARPNFWYPGATDHTSSNPWIERKAKGFIVRDLETGEHTFHAIPGVRSVFDLPAIDAEGLSPVEIDALVRSSLETVPDMAIARLVINGIPRDVGHALDQKVIKRESRRLLHLKVVENRPDPMERIREVTTERKKEVESVAAMVHRRLTARPLPPDVDRGEFVALGMKYLAQAGESHTSIIEHQRSESLPLPLEKAS